MNSEQAVANEPKPENQALTTTADPSLSLSKKKLAGSDNCLNCGTGLKGPFCYFCGQPDRNFMRFFPALLRDLMEDVLDLDSRFMRTMKPLLFKPGRLTRDYMEGRRFRYAPPMRLYIFSSIVFFLLAALLSTDAIQINSTADDDGVAVMLDEPVAERKEIEEALENLPPEAREHVDVDAILEANEGEKVVSGGFQVEDIQFNDEPWNRETNPVDIKWFPGWLNDRINDEIETSPKKAEQINENPNLIIDKVFDILPATMFILLPLVALIFKFWYLFAKRYYVEHLIFSLHNHAFLFVSLTLILLANVSEDLLTGYGYTQATTVMTWVIAIIGSWIPLYMLISLRVVYRQNWFMTLGKFVLVGLSYMTMLGLVTTGVAIASFVLL
jgi:hypothetical protein